MKKLDLSGMIFERWKVLGKVKKVGKDSAWLCRCSCNLKTERYVLTYNLTSGKSKSCGCLQKEKVRNNSKTHGYSKTRLYRIYKGMKARCYNNNNPAFKYYGKRNITICDEWLKDFNVFREWSLLNGYSENMSIDRINPNKNYCPENCRWTTMKKQQNNKLNSFFLKINGEKLTIAEWADKKNTNKQTLYSNFYRLFEQIGIKNKKITEMIINF